MAAYREEWSVFQVHGDASYLFPLPPLDVLVDNVLGHFRVPLVSDGRTLHAGGLVSHAPAVACVTFVFQRRRCPQRP